MSRAFVKEEDDAPELLPELPLSPHPNFVTPLGLALLQSRLQDAEQKLTALNEDAVDAASILAHLKRDIRWLRARIGQAIVKAPEQQPQDRVALGALVELEDDAGQRYHYRIVGEDEAAPEHGLISWVSPLAHALNGARVGDGIIWPRPAGDLPVEIVSIDYAR